MSTNCTTFKRVKFPPSQQVFITTGDGDIAKPYKPIGHLLFIKQGYRIGLPLIGLIPLSDASAQQAIDDVIAAEARAMGGNVVINLDVQWKPPSSGILELGANGGALIVQGTVIKQ